MSERSYLNLLETILAQGEQREDRTGTGTLSIFGPQLQFDLTQGFPAITTKKLAWKSVVSELLWFIEGSNDENRLREILHGERYSDKKTIWSDNATAPYWTNKRLARHQGDLGRIYGVQWRKWRKPLIRINKVVLQNHDQLLELIEGIKKDPYGRRHIITAWNPGELELMALPPCHMMSQFYVSKDGGLSCHMYQRSADMFLGVPFNIASYALFTHMIAQVCNLHAKQLIISFGDAHVYCNHIDQVREQLTRQTLAMPRLELNPSITDINKFTMEDVSLINYESHPAIKADMAV
ncbi:MAG: thymidylate synthase [Proteobacteria bacterium]|nr:thymidylate synthase [Pseudomonadota bacterium]NBP13726.1 thymidylate synthase [bacterium]